VDTLVRCEEEAIRQIGLGLEQRWLYPFAVVKLILIAFQAKAEKAIGPQEAVMTWTSLRMKDKAPDARKILQEILVHYGPIEKWHGVI
jgi:hypothetical protein